MEEQDDEDPDGEEEDKDDGSTHATVVADLAETLKPDEPGEDEGGGDDRDEKRETGGRIYIYTCHRKIRDQTPRVSRLVTKGEVTTRNHEGGRRRTRGEKMNMRNHDRAIDEFDHDHADA